MNQVRWMPSSRRWSLAQSRKPLPKIRNRRLRICIRLDSFSKVVQLSCLRREREFSCGDGVAGRRRRDASARLPASPPRERKKANRVFRDFKGLDSLSRRVPPENRKNMRPPKRKSLEIPAIPVEKGGFRPRARAGTPTSSPVNVRSRMKCGTKITPCGDAAWGRVLKKKTRLKSATAPRERRVKKTPNASGGCAFQARSMRRRSPKRALRVAHGVTLVSPRRGGSEVPVRGFSRASGALNEVTRL